MEHYEIISGDSPDDIYYVIVEEEEEPEVPEIETMEIFIDEEEPESEIIIDEAGEEVIEFDKTGFGCCLIEEIKCPYCDEWFLDKVQIMEHLKNHLGVQEYYCIFCERFYQQSYFNRHIKRHFVTRSYFLDADGMRVWKDPDATGNEIQGNSRWPKPTTCKCCEKAKRARMKFYSTKKSRKLPDPSLWETPLCIDPSDGSLC